VTVAGVVQGKRQGAVIVRGVASLDYLSACDVGSGNGLTVAKLVG
jgi:hypothetical protein